MVSGTDLASLPVTCRTVVPAEYRDEMGHMNVMWYAHLFAEATRGLFVDFGMTADYFETSEAGAFALESHTRYVAEIRVGDDLTIRTRVLGRSAKRFHAMHFMICDRDDRLSATLELIGAHIDMTTRRTSVFSDAVAQEIDVIAKSHSALTWTAPECGIMSP